MMDTSWRNTFLMSTSSQVLKKNELCLYLPLNVLYNRTNSDPEDTSSHPKSKIKTNKYIHH